MISAFFSSKLFFNRTITAFVLLLFFYSCSLMADNAVRMAYALEASAKQLEKKANGNEEVIRFNPDNNQSPYVIIISPEKGVTYDELLSKGLDSGLVNDFFPRLNYIDLKNHATLVVYQDSAISFTTYHRRFVAVSNLQVFKSTGNATIHIRKTGKTSNEHQNNICLIELY